METFSVYAMEGETNALGPNYMRLSKHHLLRVLLPLIVNGLVENIWWRIISP